MIYKFQKIAQTLKIHINSTVAPNQTNYIWKMIRKNPIYASVLVSCMFKQANLMFSAEQDKTL